VFNFSKGGMTAKRYMEEFAESKASSASNSGYQNNSYQAAPAPSPSVDIGDGFMNIPDGIDEELPFS
jgi:single-strand DNA-binding protein